MRNKKKIFLFLAMSVMLLLSVMPVFATEPEKGSIQIILTDGGVGTSKEKVTFEYTKVADLIDGQYHMLDDYGDIDLNSIKYAAEFEAAAQKINEYVIADGTVVTDQDGNALISDLDIGVYLLRVSDKARYENVSPVLITIPTFNKESGNMEYDVSVIPKHSSNTPGSITTTTPGNQDENVNIQTGDMLQLESTIAMCMVAAFGVGIILLLRYRRSKNEK